MSAETPSAVDRRADSGGVLSPVRNQLGHSCNLHDGGRLIVDGNLDQSILEVQAGSDTEPGVAGPTTPWTAIAAAPMSAYRAPAWSTIAAMRSSKLTR